MMPEMQTDPLEEKIRNQFATLIVLFQPLPNLTAFLAEELLPVNELISLQAAREVAEGLMLAASNNSAKSMLLEDRAKTQAFFSVGIAAFPTLQAALSEMPAYAPKHPAPFFEVGFWIQQVCQIS